jgi:hypothetical protein
LVADVFLHGDWNPAKSGLPSDVPEIASLLAELRARAAQSPAPTTLSTYMGPWQKFKSWCLEKNVPYLPARPLTVALYLTKILRSATSPSPVLSCSGTIFLHHHLAGLPLPTSHPPVAMSRKISRRTNVAGQKKPLLASYIRRLFGFWGFSRDATLFDLMRLVAICVSYAGFLRFSDLMAVRWEEIMFFPTHMEQFLEKTKTD